MKTPFLVVPDGLIVPKMKYLVELMIIFSTRQMGYVTKNWCKHESTYNCVFGRPTLATLDAVASTVHLKLKYHNEQGTIVTIHTDLSGVWRLYEAL